ncbi:hypothetical protein ACQKLP_09840 [Chitinophaga sp. NPDC101104]|uniref:hypothetical protein n=1 Tax=Chitinophaga sp. NPDC101104 TaxID=3390561 RepID=UPI003D08EDC1
MKKVVFAFACLMIGSGAFAAGSKSTMPAERKAAVAVKTNKSDIKVSANKQEVGNFRIQKAFKMWDACGQMITVWVSAPNGTSWDVMYSAAIDHVIDCLNSNGCYE